MKKKFLKVLALIFFVPMLLTGCLALVRSSYKEFSPVSTDLSVWGFFEALDSGRQNIFSQYETLRETRKRGYEELYDHFDNQKPLIDILRVGMTAVDLKNQTSSQVGIETYFDFEDMKDYTVTKEFETNVYTVKFKKAISYNNILKKDAYVDNILESLYFSYEIKVAVSAVSSSRDQANISIRSYSVTQPSPENIANVKSIFEKVINLGDNKQVEYSLEAENGNREILAKKIEYENGTQTGIYEKSVKLTDNSNILVKIRHSEGANFIEKTKKLPVTNPIKGFIVDFNQNEGYLGWDLTYNFEGEVRYRGESFFQGNKKFILKEIFEVTNSSVMSFGASFVNDMNFDGEDFAFKAIKSNNFTSLRAQNILKVGLYEGEPNAYLFSKDRSLQVPAFEKFG